MGTKSEIYVQDDEGNIYVIIYTQFDGYPEGVGAQLIDFLDGMHIVYGINFNQPERKANGVGCLSSQLVKYLKDSVGGIYLRPFKKIKPEFEYTYILTVKDLGKEPFYLIVYDYEDKIFEGNFDEFKEFVNKK